MEQAGSLLPQKVGRLVAAPDWSDSYNPPFRIIRARNGGTAHWSGNEPN